MTALHERDARGEEGGELARGNDLGARAALPEAAATSDAVSAAKAISAAVEPGAAPGAAACVVSVVILYPSWMGLDGREGRQGVVQRCQLLGRVARQRPFA